MYDEARAVMEIRKLSGDARCHLAHILRNFLQSISSIHENGLPSECGPLLDEVREEVRKVTTELEEMRI